jgi:hypothetical protein
MVVSSAFIGLVSKVYATIGGVAKYLNHDISPYPCTISIERRYFLSECRNQGWTAG